MVATILAVSFFLKWLCWCSVILETDPATIAGRVAMRGPDDQMSMSEQVHLDSLYQAQSTRFEISSQELPEAISCCTKLLALHRLPVCL